MNYLNDDYIIELAKIKDYPSFVLTSSKSISKNVSKSKYISSVKVNKKWGFVLVIDVLENKEMNFHYRSSFLQTHRDYVCLEVILKLNVGKREAIEDVIRERRERRVASQPLEYPSAGSVFRNPEGGFAGQLIEESGLKGMTKGGAMISDKHANFVINYKDATSSDIKYLIDLAHDTVLEKYNVDMKIEQEFVNWE